MPSKTHSIKSYFNSETYNRLKKEAAIRNTTLSQTIRDCLEEYLQIRQEMASVFELPGKLGEEHQAKIIHNIIARSEVRMELELEKLDQKIDCTNNEAHKNHQYLALMLEGLALQIFQRLPILHDDKASKTTQTKAKMQHEQLLRWVKDSLSKAH